MRRNPFAWSSFGALRLETCSKARFHAARRDFARAMIHSPSRKHVTSQVPSTSRTSPKLHPSFTRAEFRRRGTATSLRQKTIAAACGASVVIIIDVVSQGRF
jgi:hypothetical protein